MTDPADLTATVAAQRIRSGDLSSVELVRACLARIDERESEIHAWVEVDAEGARSRARELDGAGSPVGPLHGIPVGIKDIIDTEDLPTGYGSPSWAGHRPDRDAECVRRLREAGAIVLGKTVTTEFATFHPGPTVNPADPSRTPGGSSSGSAAAVAAGMVPLALGTQTAGSIVRPAAFVGVWGLKPTYGSYPLDGVRPVAPSLDTLGHLTRCADDLALVAAVLAAAGPASPADDAATRRPVPGGGDGHDARQPEGATPRIAYAPTAHTDRLEASTRARLEEVAAQLRLDTVTLPDDFAALPAAQEVVMAREAFAALGPERERGPISAALVRLLDEGAQITDDVYADAIGLAARCRTQLTAVFDDVDALLTPAVPGEAPEGLASTGDPLLCRSWTLLGAPTVAVPGLRGPAGAPLGVQVVAAPGDDLTAVRAARHVGAQLDELTRASVPAREAPPS